MAVTIRDVAREAGVAVCTVSFAMNGSAHVAEETKRRILETVERLNYKPNQSARGLVTKKTNNIGLVVSEKAEGLENSILLDVIKGLGQAASEKNYDLLISFLRPQTDRVVDGHLLEVYQKQSADGLILMGTRMGETPYKELVKKRFPFVLLGRPDVESACHSVNADNEQGAYQAVRFLAGRGHRRIGFITPCSIDVDASLDRLNGYKRAVAELGLDEDEKLIAYGSFDPESGNKETEMLLSLKHRPTAILAGRDVIASRVVERAKLLGYGVPEDLAVVGFDNSVVMQVSQPSITAVELPMMRMGYEAAKLLIQLVEGEIRYDDTQKVVLPCRIFEREST